MVISERNNSCPSDGGCPSDIRANTGPGVTSDYTPRFARKIWALFDW
jgi:hypothetical protein